MLPVPPNSSTTVAAATNFSSFSSSTSDFFLKDGHKICVGDCALFKPPQDSPPFIGLIQKLIAGKEDSLSLWVNWLYRTSGIKLGKGSLLDVAPNEVFYSFHKDKVPAASLLHPCKVAFLHKGVELPSGISSFVCRRVYDIENKCLWWLTDKDYINEQRDEVDKLLDRTRLEMHGVVQSGGCSPKLLNGPASATQLKTNSESAQNSSSLASHGKVKKRERGDQVSDLAKRERLSKLEDGDLSQSRGEHTLKLEITKITQKGGLVDFEGVEKLVQLMQPDSVDKRIDLAGRIMLVDVIAATDRFDCLVWFVQLKGLLVLDEWLQDVHKGKFGGGTSPKESEKCVEEFVLALLRALDKLPVNLHALQACNVGRSVNHLRAHKNSEIHKKARSLVDTWKKRVEAEMNMNDEKSRGVSWAAKPAPSEVSHVGNRKPGGSAEASMRSSVTQASRPKSSQVKLVAGESVANSSVLPATMKSLTVSAGCNSTDANSKMLIGGGTSDPPLTPIKEERSSSSSQSPNNSHSCSTDQAKPVGSSYQEDARSSTAGSATVSRGSGGASRHQTSSNGVHMSAASGVRKDPGTRKLNAANKNSTSEKASPTGISYDKMPDVPPVDHGNSQRLIVRLPNAGRSPSRGANGGSFENFAGPSTASPPGEEPDNYERRVKGRSEALLSNAGSNMNPDLCQGKDGLCGSDEAKVIAACDEPQKIGEDGVKLMEASKTTHSLLGVLPRPGKAYDTSLSPIKALVESCAKFSEASVSASPEDDVGMNLLASVAAGEILKGDNITPLAPPTKNSPIEEELSLRNDGKSTQMSDEVDQNHNKPSDMGGADFIAEKHSSGDLLQGKNEGRYPPLSMVTDASGDEEVPLGTHADKKFESSAVLNTLRQAALVPSLGSDEKPEDVTSDASVLVLSKSLKIDRSSCSSDSELRMKSPVLNDDKRVDCTDAGTEKSNMAAVSELPDGSVKSGREVDEEASCSLLVIGCLEQVSVDKEPCSVVSAEQRQSHKVEVHQESLYRKSEDASPPSAAETVLAVEVKAEIPCDSKVGHQAGQNERPTSIVSSISECNNECNKENLESKDAPGVSDSRMGSPAIAVHNSDKLDRVESEGIEGQLASGANASVSAAGSGMTVKLDFDLNEGFPMDDGNQLEPTKSIVHGPSVHLPGPFPFPFSSVSGSSSNSVTAAAAAKGSFFLPKNPLQSKGELEWKGLAAKSPFRPAEPRKNLEMLLNTGESLADCGGKQGRPPLDFDLNVPDERVLEDVTSQNSARPSCSEFGPRDCPAGGLDFDLNRVDESSDAALLSGNTSRLEIPAAPNRLSFPGGLSNGVLNASRDFDLNNGPSLDEVATETADRSQSIKNSLPFLSTVPTMRMNGAEFTNFSSWFPPANSYSAFTVPSMLPGRGEQSYVAAAGSQRILAPSSSSTSFGLEMYRPVVSSSPAVPLPTGIPFQYPGFPFETSFPLSSNTFSSASTAYIDSSCGGPPCFPTVPMQIVGPAGVVSSPYPQPYVMSLPGSSSISSDSRKWGGQLDLNSGPGGTDTEWRDERLPLTTRRHPVSSPQIPAEEQMRIYHHMAGGMGSSVFKRKEPDGSWDPADRFSSYKQSSWH